MGTKKETISFLGIIVGFACLPHRPAYLGATQTPKFHPILAMSFHFYGHQREVAVRNVPSHFPLILMRVLLLK